MQVFPKTGRWAIAMVVVVSLGTLAPPVSAYEPDQTLPVAVNVSMGDGEKQPDLTRFIWLYEDQSGVAELVDIIAVGDKFRLSDRMIKNSKVSKSVFWIRLNVENTGDQPGKWVLSLNRVLLNPAAVYFVTQNETQLLLQNTPQAFQRSYKEFQTLAGRFHLDAGDSGVLYARYRGANWSGIQPLLFEESAFEGARQEKNTVFLLLLGGVVSLILFGSISSMYLGKQIFLLYAVGQIAFFTFYAHMSGYTTVYLWPGNPQFGRIVGPTAMVIFAVAMAQFARSFFATRQTAPVMDRLLLAVIAAGLFTVVLIPLDYILPAFPRTLPVILAALVTAVCWILLPYLAVRVTLTYDRDAWPLAVAWVLTAIALIGIQMLWVGFSGTLPFGTNLYGVTAGWEALFLALAIALRVRRLSEDKVEAQQRLGESLQLQLAASQRATRMAEEREWALQDLAEKGRLLLAAGHDTRQMLSALRNYATGFRRGALKNETGAIDEQKLLAASHAIDEVADSLNSVLTTAVEGSRSGGVGDTIVALDRVNASSILDPLVLIHGHGSDNNAVSFSVRAAPVLITTDSVLVLRILGNLLSNAFKFTAQGRVLLAARRCATGARFQVWDTGCGIAPEVLSKLLDSDHQGHRVDDSIDGLGAGLKIALNLAARLGGKIRGSSTPGKGSMFELFLPECPGGGEGVETDTSFLLLDRDAAHITQVMNEAVQGVGLVEVCDDVVDLERQLVRHKTHRPVLLVDQKFVDDEEQLRAIDILIAKNPQLKRVVLTYDRSGDARARFSRCADLILYRPISSQALIGAARILLT